MSHCPQPGPDLEGYPPSPLPCHTGTPHIGTATHDTAFTGYSDFGPFLGVTLVLALLGAGLLRAIRRERG